MVTTKELDAFFKVKMKESGKTQKEVAEELGYRLPQNFLNKLHRGTFRSLEERKLAQLLGYEVQWVKKDSVRGLQR